jgi:hypothetical protein
LAKISTPGGNAADILRNRIKGVLPILVSIASPGDWRDGLSKTVTVTTSFLTPKTKNQSRIPFGRDRLHRKICAAFSFCELLIHACTRYPDRAAVIAAASGTPATVPNVIHDA